MLKVKNGDLEKLSFLYKKYKLLLYNFFVKQTFDKEISNDLLQNLFYRIIKYRESYNESKKFYKMLSEENQKLNNNITNTKKGKLIKLFSPIIKVAAVILILITGVLIGMQLTKNNPSNNIAELEKLNSEVVALKKVVMISMLEGESASDRMQVVNYIDEQAEPDDELVNVLIKIMETDQNVNVRIEAVIALARFDENLIVRDALIKSLEIQTEPSIQIMLINILVEMEEKRAYEPLKQLMEKENTHEAVKSHAENSLKVLV